MSFVTQTVSVNELTKQNKRILLVLSIAFVLPLLGLLYYFLQPIADYLIYDLIGLNKNTHLAESINFFIYDTLKILILLFLISSLMGVVKAYFPIDRLRNLLIKRKMYGLQYLFASFFGAITPFCSCSSIP